MKKPVSIRIIEKGGQKFAEHIYSDGTVELIPAPPKVQTRRRRRPQQRVKNMTRQKQF